jgi:UDP:flavonoid glycosyltransferase YjiC (YdhE family)
MSQAPLRVILGAFGTLGEVHPFIAVGRALRARGHDVCLIAPGKYAYLAQAAGLSFSPLWQDAELERFLGQKYLWHPLLGYPLLAKGVGAIIEPAYHAVLEQHVPGRTVLVLSWMLFGGRLAQETLNIPAVTLDLSPVVLRSLIAPPNIPPMPLSPDRPVGWNRFWYGVIDAVIDRAFADPLNAFRAKLGLPTLHHVLRDWIHSPDRIIGLFPDWFATPQPDWPKQTVLTGFPLYDEAEVTPLDPELAQFLDAGEPPVAVTIGTGMRHGSRFLQSAIETARRLKRRAVVLAQRAEQVPANLSDGVLALRYAPHSALLPRCAAIIHHGGIGTTAQALRAGIPQIVVPATFDQADNGARLARLGVAVMLPARRFDGANGAAALQSLMQPEALAACAAAKWRLSADDAMPQTVQWIEQAARAT